MELRNCKEADCQLCSSHWETRDKSCEIETGAFLLTTGELAITLQLCCHTLPGFLSFVLVMLLLPQRQEFLSRGFFIWTWQPSVAEETACFAAGFSESSSMIEHTVEVRGGCAERQRCRSRYRTAIHPCPRQQLSCRAEGSSLHHLCYGEELSESSPSFCISSKAQPRAYDIFALLQLSSHPSQEDAFVHTRAKMQIGPRGFKSHPLCWADGKG